ncbi:MAG: stage III sporulation protein AE [Clostridiales bacterium]|jgi:stage III sporulation protein AE|nr:stage III sporulation protein AE [Clostridiales bacterium]
MKKFLMLCFVLIIFNNCVVYASQAEEIENQLDLFEFGDVNESTGLDFKGLVLKAINGELDLSPQSLINSAAKLIFGELYLYNSLVKNIIIIAMLSAILRTLTDSFSHKEVGELGFYITYIVLVIVLFNSVRVGINIMASLVIEVSEIMEALIPLVMSLLIMSGYVSSAAAFNTTLFFSVNFFTRVIEFFVAPAVNLLAIIQMVNYLSAKDLLTSLADQGAKALGFCLKAIGVSFIAILSLQRVTTPIINNLFLRAAKFSVNAVPVVGGALSGAVDTVVYFTKAMRSGFMAAGVIAVITVSLVPLIKIAVLAVTYKIIAALLEPICEERLTKCIESAGKVMALVLGAAFIVALMFIFYLMIVLSL